MDIIEGVLVVCGDANHEYVSILVPTFSIDAKVLITRGIVDFYLNLLLILGVPSSPVNVENSRFVVVVEAVV